MGETEAVLRETQGAFNVALTNLTQAKEPLTTAAQQERRRQQAQWLAPHRPELGAAVQVWYKKLHAPDASTWQRADARQQHSAALQAFTQTLHTAPTD